MWSRRIQLLMSCTTLSIPNHFNQLFYHWNEMQSKEGTVKQSSVMLWHNVSYNGNVLWANFTLPSPTHTHTHSRLIWRSVLTVAHLSFTFLVFLKVWFIDPRSLLHMLTVGSQLCKGRESCFSWQTKNLLYQEGFKKGG